MNIKEQNICVNLDDSGKLSLKEKTCVYGGIAFLSKSSKDKFITQYRIIVDDIKCKYCKDNKDICQKICPELKHNMLRANHKRRLINYIKNYIVVACIIDNEKVYENIMNDKASRGRYLDYALRMLIKEMIKYMIKKRTNRS